MQKQNAFTSVVRADKKERHSHMGMVINNNNNKVEPVKGRKESAWDKKAQ